MSTISLRLSDEDAKLFKKYAQTQGLTITDFIKNTVLEKIEDDFDLKELRKAMKNNNSEFLSIDQVDQELGF